MLLAERKSYLHGFHYAGAPSSLRITVHGTVHHRRDLGTRLSAYDICRVLTFEDSSTVPPVQRLAEKWFYLGLSDEKITVPFVPFIPFRSVHSIPFRSVHSVPFRSVPGFSTTPVMQRLPSMQESTNETTNELLISQCHYTLHCT